MLDRLTAAQAAAIRVVVAEFISAAAMANDTHGGRRRNLPFAGLMNGPTDLAARSDEIIRSRFGTT
jgi:hypothetical protein